MKKSLLTLCGLFTFVVLMNCSSNDTNKNSLVVGAWKLTTWTINIPLDINNDNVSSTNLLEEIQCVNNETLVFDTQGIVTSNNTFHPKINIGIANTVNQEYIFDIECSEGIISSASNYIENGNDTITIDDELASINGNTLIRTFKNAYKIYDENFINVKELKDLVLIYTKL